MTINPSLFRLENIKLIIGLGNPGQEYENTYHNAGFIAIDFLAKKLGAQNISVPSRHRFTLSKTNHFYLVKPNLFMNQSGSAVSQAIKLLKIPPDQILIIHDDSDIELGSYKFSYGRGEAGHKGISSVINNLKNKNFWRLRLGIRPALSFGKNNSPGRPIEIKRLKAGDFVLKEFKPSHLKTIYSVLGGIIAKLNENEKP